MEKVAYDRFGSKISIGDDIIYIGERVIVSPAIVRVTDIKLLTASGTLRKNPVIYFDELYGDQTKLGSTEISDVDFDSFVFFDYDSSHKDHFIARESINVVGAVFDSINAIKALTN